MPMKNKRVPDRTFSFCITAQYMPMVALCTPCSTLRGGSENTMRFIQASPPSLKLPFFSPQHTIHDQFTSQVRRARIRRKVCHRCPLPSVHTSDHGHFLPKISDGRCQRRGWLDTFDAECVMVHNTQDCKMIFRTLDDWERTIIAKLKKNGEAHQQKKNM